jgi:hypothetical protein
MARQEQLPVVALAAALLIAGCAGDAAMSKPCTPGQTAKCQCANGAGGQQTCSASRTYGACSCTPSWTGIDGGAGLFSDAGKPGRFTADSQLSSSPVTPQPAADSQPAATPKPDKGGTFTCPATALFNQVMRIGQSETVTSGAQQLAVKLTDVGSASYQPAALLELDGNSGSLEIVPVGQSVTTGSNFKVLVPEIQNVGAASARWARICVTHP